MHDIKLIRKNSELYSKKLLDRNIKIDLKSLLNLDKKNRELIQNKEKLEQEKKIISKKKDESQFSRSKEISKEIEKLDKFQVKIQDDIDQILNTLPNIALDDVPIGKDENSNKIINKHGELPNFNFKPISHEEIGKKINQMDFNTASKTSCSSIVFLKK